MNRTLLRSTARNAVLLALLPLTFAKAQAQQWTAPTEEELKMTAQPEVPGAPAVYLFKEEITDDQLHMWSVYVRLKVLTERGKENANVELRQYSESEGGGYTVNGVAGRTIHPDGTIIPFTGKPFEKLIEKGQGYKEMAKVFTLPDVEVGSIIEYRYQLRYDDNYFFAPDWFIQTDLYLRKGHYLWKPTDKELVSKNERGEQTTSRIAWFPILPKDTQVKQDRTPTGQLVIELSAHDIPPAPDEEHMPPIRSLTDRVLFYYTSYASAEEYWKSEGKGWTKLQDKFIGPGPKVRAAVQELVAPADTPDQKLRKLYARVMQLDNTAFDRSRSAAEDKSQGLGEAKSTDDILDRKRGTDDQMAQLFVAMARAAGMKAYVMAVTSRDRNLFVPSYLSFSQLNDLVAVVNVDGKDQFFDPGQRYCPYNHLAWKHSLVGGLRQIDGGSAIAQTPSETYVASKTQRIADLTLDEHGEVAGTVTMIWSGAPALRWRQTALRGDTTSLQRDLKTSLEDLLPASTEITVGAIKDLDDYEKPLTVSYEIKGAIASSAGKRMLVPGNIFVMNDKPIFPHEKREQPIYFDYPQTVLDAVRYKFPSSLTLESAPAADKIPFQKFAIYQLSSDTAASTVTVHRSFVLGEIIFKTEEYPELRTFYGKFETKDQEPLVLKAAAGAAPSGN
jgi:Transglutaminase-like superfamily/Domain of Unknown Function with PDB structure (DUF3857)